ncbi:hypothetical protein BD311DRAFT_667616, partial [Dichomitus squalens]
QHQGGTQAPRTMRANEHDTGNCVEGAPRVVDITERGEVLADGGRSLPGLSAQVSLSAVAKLRVFAHETEDRSSTRPPLADEVVRLGVVQPGLFPADKPYKQDIYHQKYKEQLTR